MDGLRLPGIVPAQPVDSAASAIEKAGAQFVGAADALAGFGAEVAMAQVHAQATEATLQTQKGLNDALDIIKSNPYVTPGEVNSLFGGKVPEGIRLEDEVYPPGATAPVKQPRAVIPMHEVAPHLFNDAATRTVENAARNITGSGWQAKFREAAAADVERARNEAMDWTRAQALADSEIKSVAQFQQAVAMRSWNTARAILDNPGMRVETREKLLAELPGLRTHAMAVDELRAAGTPAEVDKVIGDITANDKFPTPLSAEDQWKLTALARERKHQIVAEQEHAAKAAYEANLQRVGNLAEQAVTTSMQTGRPATSYLTAADIAREAPGLKWEDTRAILNFLKEHETAKSKEPDWAVFSHYADLRKSGELGKMTIADLYRDVGRLGSKYDEVVGWWMNAKEDKGPPKPLLSNDEEAQVNYVVENFLHKDPKKKGDEFGIARGRLLNAMDEWRKKNPEGRMDYNIIRTEAARLFGAEDKNDEAVLSATLPTITGRVPTTGEIADAKRGIDEQAPHVDDAFKVLVNPKEQTLDTGFRARVYGLTQNPTTRAALVAKAGSENPRRLVFEAVRALAPRTETNAAFQAQQESDAVREAQSREAQAAGKRIASEEKSFFAGEKADAAAADRALPTWERVANGYVRRAIESDRAYVEQQVTARAVAEYRKAHPAKAGDYGGFSIGAPDSPIPLVARQRIAAEVDQLSRQHETEIRARFDDAKAAYRLYLEKKGVTDPEAIMNGGALSFPTWFQAWRDGKVK